MEQVKTANQSVDSSDLFFIWLRANENHLGEAVEELGVKVTDGPRFFERLRDTVTFALMMRGNQSAIQDSGRG